MHPDRWGARCIVGVLKSGKSERLKGRVQKRTGRGEQTHTDTESDREIRDSATDRGRHRDTLEIVKCSWTESGEQYAATDWAAAPGKKAFEEGVLIEAGKRVRSPTRFARQVYRREVYTDAVDVYSGAMCTW